MIRSETSTYPLRELPVGSRLIVQCKNDWRTAAVSTVTEEKIVLIISSPSGRNYRKSCPAETLVEFDGAIPVLGAGIWRETFVNYDLRW